MTRQTSLTRYSSPRHLGPVWASCLLGLTLACSPDPEPSDPPTGMDQGGGEVDMQVDPPGPDTGPGDEQEMGPPVQDEDMGQDMPPACEPLEQCPADTCGMVEDGCGGMLDCGACACESGQLTADSDACGPCDLGRLTCGDDETGAGTCVAPETGAVDLSLACDQLLYVQEGASEQLAEGTRDFPYPSIRQALEDAEALEGPALVLVAEGTYEEAPTGRDVPAGLEMREQVSVVGGFDDQWRFDPEARTRINVLQLEDGVPLIGVDAAVIDDPTALAHLQIRTQDLTGEASLDNYGLRAQTASGLVVSHVIIEAGRASDGTSGGDGLEGANGEPGGDAGLAIWARRADRPQGGDVNGADAGEPGTNMLCPAADGGGGGLGAHAWLNPVQGTAGTYDAEDGLKAPTGAQGGQAGVENAPNGNDGIDGPDGNRGEDGSAGELGGQLEDGFWVLASGDGQPGTRGDHGGGGSGGGGSWWPTDDTSDHKFFEMPGGSGGGGAGGCGGGGGEAGTAGGSSIGALLVVSDGITLIESTFRSGDAGAGGTGGRGARPGAGAQGGSGTTQQAQFSSSNDPDPHPLDSGRGGAGGDGGEGGDGGSGIGGSSFGALCEGTRLELQGEVTFEAGAGGTGGQGSLPAPDGDAADQQNCQ